MRFLLDTHLLIWSLIIPDKLSKEARSIMEDSSHTFIFSAISIWEIALKFSLGRPDFIVDPKVARNTLLSHGLLELPLTSLHAQIVATLPFLHRDPADRILIAQAIVEDITLLTADAIVAQYPGPIRKV